MNGIPPHPSDLSELGSDDLKQAIASRGALIERIFAEAGPNHDLSSA